MGIDQQAQNDGMQNEGMKTDPKWSAQEKEKYAASYHAAKKKQEDQKD